MSFSRLLARLFMVPIGLILAMLAAGIFLSFALLAMDPIDVAHPEAQNMFAVFSGVVIATAFGSVAFYPALLGLIVAELLSWRSIWIYLGFGFALSFFAFRAPGEPADDIAIALDIRAVAAGLIGGFVYWLVAGRGAGIVKRTIENRPKCL